MPNKSSGQFMAEIGTSGKRGGFNRSMTASSLRRIRAVKQGMYGATGGQRQGAAQHLKDYQKARSQQRKSAAMRGGGGSRRRDSRGRYA